MTRGRKLGGKNLTPEEIEAIIQAREEYWIAQKRYKVMRNKFAQRIYKRSYGALTRDDKDDVRLLSYPVSNSSTARAAWIKMARRLLEKARQNELDTQAVGN